MGVKMGAVDHGQGAEEGAAPWDRVTGAAVQSVDRWVEERLEDLYQLAEAQVAQCQGRLAEAARDRPPSAVGKVGVRVRRQTSPAATPGSFTIDWVIWNYARTHSGRKCHTRYIPRGAGDGYQRRSFQGIARRWQMPLIMAAEDVFASLRRRARLIAAVRTQLRAAIRAGTDQDDASPEADWA